VFCYQTELHSKKIKAYPAILPIEEEAVDLLKSRLAVPSEPR
jgi:hypothetical protein